MSQYLDTATELAQKVAGEALGHFTADTREDGSTFYTVANEGTPEWVTNLVYSAHGDFMPEDWRYEQIMHALGAIQDASEDADLTEIGHEFADGTVDVYTADRLRWLASNLNRPSYCDEYLGEFGAGMPDGGIVELVGLGQYMEAREIWGYVVSALEDRCAEIETETTEDDEKRDLAMSEAIITEEHAGMTIEIHHDDDPMNPFTDYSEQPGRILRWTREFDIGKEIQEPDGMIECPHCQGTGYDPAGSKDPTDRTSDCKHCVGTGDQESDDLAQWFSVDYNAVLALPLRFADYGVRDGVECGVSEWDRANAVWIFTAKDLQTEWLESADDATEYATAVLKDLSDYYQGNVYGYVVKDPTGDHVDSCWGFIGEPWGDDSYIMAEARQAAEYGAEKVAQEATEAFRAACSDVATVA